MRRRVFIAGPIVKGDLGQNIERATVAFYELLRAGLAPLCPHFSCWSGSHRSWMYPGTDRQEYWVKAEVLPRDSTLPQWYGQNLPWVDVSEAVLRLPGEGKGSDGEVARAEELGIPVFYSVADVLAWAGVSRG